MNSTFQCSVQLYSVITINSVIIHWANALERSKFRFLGAVITTRPSSIQYGTPLCVFPCDGPSGNIG